MCTNLVNISTKQLRDEPVTESENEFLGRYGELLANIMLYGGNSYHHPRDDAPRIVDVHHDPGEGDILHAGIGRPRGLLVLMPRPEGDLICAGAVLPYHEFSNPTRLTDEEWANLLHDPEAPPPPKWLAPIIPPP